MNRKSAKPKTRRRPSGKDLAKHRERMKSHLLAALKKGAETVEVGDSDGELQRQAALAARRSQRNSQQRAASAIGAKMADPREDMKELQDDLGELRDNIFLLDQEIHDLEASQSMAFPSASEIANVSAAVGVLDARVAASSAAGAIMAAATDVLNAWGA